MTVQCHIQCEHFIHALLPRSGYKTVMSKGVTQLLSRENLQMLMHIGDHIKKETTVRVWLPDVNILSISYLRPAKDQYSRSGVWNHTILLKIQNYFTLADPTPTLKPYFIRDFNNGVPTTLEPLMVTT